MIVESAKVRDALLAWYDRLSAKDVAAFGDVVEVGTGSLTIGTAPGEWITEEDGLRHGFVTEGFVVTRGPRPTGYAEGTLGWAVDEPTLDFEDGTAWATRLTAVMHETDDRWRVVHLHLSVGVPDEEATALQERWGTVPSP